MILLTNLEQQTLQPGQALTFNRSIIDKGCSECWRNPGNSVKLRERGIYDIDFGANVAGTTTGAVLQLSVQLGGSTLPETTMISSPSAANVFNNVSRATATRLSCCDFDRISVVNTGTVPIIVGANSALRIERRF